MAGGVLLLWLLGSATASAALEELNMSLLARTEGLNTLLLEIATVSCSSRNNCSTLKELYDVELSTVVCCALRDELVVGKGFQNLVPIIDTLQQALY